MGLRHETAKRPNRYRLLGRTHFREETRHHGDPVHNDVHAPIPVSSRLA
jgi:hypothetical protein